MAQTNQEISLRLTVESAGFNEKLLKARKALYAIESAGIKAAGGQKKYAAAVKRARMATKWARETCLSSRKSSPKSTTSSQLWLLGTYASAGT